MSTDKTTRQKPPSTARLEANRRNAQLSTGPSAEGKKRSRFNAVKHGLSSNIAWLEKVSPEDREYLQRATLQLGPRNAIERLHVEDLLSTRLRERLSLEVERLVLTRQPVSVTGSDERPFPFLRDPSSLNTFQQLARHVAHLSQAAEKGILALLRVRKDNWAVPNTNSTEDRSLRFPNAVNGSSTSAALTNENATTRDKPEFDPLDECLHEHCVILPGEDVNSFEVFARELWQDFSPTSLLEAFLVQDVIQTQWRCVRIRNLQHLVHEWRSRSLTGHDCGLAFGFLSDSQGLCALEILQQYEKVLSRRLEKRMALFRRVRKEGWVDIGCSPSGSNTASQCSHDCASDSGASDAPDSSSATVDAQEESREQNLGHEDKALAKGDSPEEVSAPESTMVDNSPTEPEIPTSPPDRESGGDGLANSRKAILQNEPNSDSSSGP